MPFNHYACLVCGHAADYFLRASDLDTAGRPPCPAGHGVMSWVPETPPHVGQLNWDVDLGREGGLIHLDSIQAANRLERDSLQRERNGEGQAIVFRALHQDRSNFDRAALPGVEDTRRDHLEAARQRGRSLR